MAKLIRPSPAENAILLILAVVLGYVGAGTLGAPVSQSSDWIRNTLSHICAASALFLFGYVARRAGLLEWAMRSWEAIFVAGILIVWLVTAIQAKAPVMSTSRYPAGPLVFYAGAVSGSFVVLWLSRAIAASAAGGVLRVLGEHSRAIMANHLFVFAIINLGFVSAHLLPANKVTALMGWNVNWTWPVYVVAG